MADPPTPTTPVASPDTTAQIQATTGALGDLNQNYIQTTSSALDFSAAQQGQVSVFQALNTQVQNFNTYLGALSAVNDTNTAGFGLMSAALIKATESFKTFSNVDTSRLSTFSDQYKKLLGTIKDSPIGSTAAQVAIDTFSSSLEKSGASQSTVAKIASDLKKGIMSTAESFLMGADNTLRYENALIQNAAAQGNMQKLLSQTGQSFEHLNDVAGAQIKIMEKSMGATNSTKEQMESYMNTLKDLPGGLSALGENMEVAGQKTSVLTAAIQYAHGSGRDMRDVTADMSEAMNSYGTSTEDALKYSARMSQVSETLGARVDDVRAAINGSAEAFKSFVWGGVSADDMTKGLSDAMETYANRLKGIGVPIKNAIEMSKNLQSQMANMSVGQEALTSQMTGGPGGVRGALQYERLMKENPQEAMKKMDESIRKMMGGKMVTEKQAEGSDAAASQFMKQTMLIQKFTGTQNRQQAEAMSDAMASGNLNQAAMAQKGGLDETVKRGQAFEDLSRTKVSQMNVTTDSVILSGGVANLNTQQDATAARSGRAGGSDGKGRGTNPDQQAQLRQWSNDRTGGMHMDSAVKQLMNLSTELPESLKASVQSYSESLSNGDTSKNAEDTEALKERIAAARAQGGSASEMSALDKLQAGLSTTKTDATGSGGTGGTGGTSNGGPVLGGIFGGFGKQGAPGTQTVGGVGHGYSPAGKQVGSVIPGIGGQGGAGTGTTTGQGGSRTGGGAAVLPGLGGGGGQPIPVTLAPGSVITVQHTGTCPHCGRQSTTSEQARTLNAPSTSHNQSP